jgi:hypothetical protein
VDTAAGSLYHGSSVGSLASHAAPEAHAAGSSAEPSRSWPLELTNNGTFLLKEHLHCELIGDFEFDDDLEVVGVKDGDLFK